MYVYIFIGFLFFVGQKIWYNQIIKKRHVKESIETVPSYLLFSAVFVKTIRLTVGSGDRYYLGLKGRRVVEVHVCRGDQYVTICADTWSNIEASCQQPGYPPYGNRK